MNIGRSLKIALVMKEMRQTELAEKIGCNQSNISYWASRGSKIHLETVEKLASALGYPVSEFIALGEEKAA